MIVVALLIMNIPISELFKSETNISLVKYIRLFSFSYSIKLGKSRAFCLVIVLGHTDNENTKISQRVKTQYNQQRFCGIVLLTLHSSSHCY